MPQDAADASSLFENDNDVEIASSRSHRSRRDSSSEASRPPTSESEGMFDDPRDSGEEEVDEDGDFPRHVSVRSRGSNTSKSSRVSILHTYYFIDVLLILLPQRPSKRDAALNAEVYPLRSCFSTSPPLTVCL